MLKIGQRVRIIDTRPKACCQGMIGTIRSLESSSFGYCFIVETKQHACAVKYYDMQTAHDNGFENERTVVALTPDEELALGLSTSPPAPPTAKITASLPPPPDLPVATTAKDSVGLSEATLVVNCALCSNHFPTRPGTYLAYGGMNDSIILYACPSCIDFHGDAAIMADLQDRWLAATSTTATAIPIKEFNE
ncbi:MAG: hypothetical protein AB1489_12325 [Acidobacteriota bacterium]